MKPRKNKRPQEEQFFRPKQASLRREKALGFLVLNYRMLAAAKVKIKPKSFFEKAELSRMQGLKRFEALSAEKDRALVEAIAIEYAKIFNAGLVAGSVGLETYYTEAGKETFCFAGLNGIEKAPLIKISKFNDDSLTVRMKKFYETISMHDPEARKLFVEAFSKNLNNELQALFQSAIMTSFKKTY